MSQCNPIQSSLVELEIHVEDSSMSETSVSLIIYRSIKIPTTSTPCGIYTLPQTFGFSEMSAVARFGTSEMSVQARFRVRTFFRCAQVKNVFELECPICMVVVQPQDLPKLVRKRFEKIPTASAGAILR